MSSNTVLDKSTGIEEAAAAYIDKVRAEVLKYGNDLN